MIALSIAAISLAAAERPLEYYLADPCLRQIPAERFMPCSQPLRKLKAQARLAGKVREFQHDPIEIYDVDYSREGSPQADARAILAGPSKAQLREIFRQVNNEGTFLPTQVSPWNSRHEWIEARWKSNGGTIVSDYLQRRNGQWLALDFSPVFEVARKALPAGDAFALETANIDMEAQVYRVETQAGGDIDVPFRIAEPLITGTARFHKGGEAPRLWTRRVGAGKGSYTDAVEPHPLHYFYPHPCLRKDPAEQPLIAELSCNPRDRASLLSVKSKLRKVGRIDEFHAYEIDYRGGGQGPLERKLRTVLIGRSLDALYEVWIRDSTFSMGDAAPTQIVMAGGTQPLIETNFFDGGMYVFNYQTFFWLRPRGPQMVDFSAVFEAAGKALPKGEEIHQPTTNYGIRQLRYQVGSFEAKYGFSKSVCCVGKVEVPYTIEDGIAKPVAGKTQYQGRVR